MRTVTETTVGTQSEVGKLRTVIVHRPDLAHERLTPPICREHEFEDVMWVRRARQELNAFIDVMRDHDVEVLLLHELLAQAVDDPAGRAWLLDRRVRPENVIVTLVEPLRAWLTELPSDELASCLTGGLTLGETPAELRSSVGAGLPAHEFVLAPLPSHLYTRGASAWLYGGVTLNPMASPARGIEALNIEAIYRFHPRFKAAEFEIWLGGADHERGLACLDGRDEMPLGDGVVLVGMGPRSNAQAVGMLARALFEAGAARLVLGAQMPEERPDMHLDGVWSFCDRNVAAVFEPVVSRIRPLLFTAGGESGVHTRVSERALGDEVKDALGLEELKLIPTGRDDSVAGRGRWDDGNDIVALEPGVVVAYERHEETNARLARAGVEVLAISGQELGRVRAGAHSLTCPIVRDG